MTRFRLILAAICIILLANFSLMVHFELKQKATLSHATAIGLDNQLWQFFQLNNEYQRLREAVQYGNPNQREQIDLRFDIFYSRINGFATGEIESASLFQNRELSTPFIAPLIKYIQHSSILLEKPILSQSEWLDFKKSTQDQEVFVNQLIQEARTHDAQAVDANNQDIRRWSGLRIMLATAQMLVLLIFASLGVFALWRSEKSRHQLAETAISLLEARQLADVANAAKSRFLAHISHEIRTPLTSILGYADRLSRKASLAIEDRREIDHIAKSGAHLLSLLNNVLDLSKADQNKLTLMNETLNFKQLKQELETMFEMMAQNKSIQFELLFAPDLPENLELDVGKFRQILINLISNSLKFTHSGRISVTFYGQRYDDYYQLFAAVCDSGCGIKIEDQARIFQPFEQSESGQLAGGTGLGLALSRDYARLMQGDIHFTSRIDCGSEFTVNVKTQPLTVAYKSTHPVASPQTMLSQPLMGKLILVVEDQDVNREMMCEILHDFGAQTLQAIHGLDGLQQVLLHPEIDAIIMDYQMPEMNGIAAAMRLRAQGWSKPIYLVSASPLSELQLTAGFSAFTGHLRKPFTIDEIVNLLNGLPATLTASHDASALLDAKTAMHNLGFTAERYWAICHKGLNRIIELELDFIEALSSGAEQDAVRHAHSAKGVALQIGANALGEAWAQLEAQPILPLTEIMTLRTQTQQALIEQQA